jgi:hypothetical protein
MFKLLAKTFTSIAIVLLMVVSCNPKIESGPCHAEVLCSKHLVALGAKLYFWDVDCDNICDGATLEYYISRPGKLNMIPLSCAEGYKLWEEYLEEQRRMGA